VKELQEILRRYMLRREKRDVELTLPKKTETVIEVELTLTQKR
jgi:SNF2 family DNA or RNA helicase